MRSSIFIDEATVSGSSGDGDGINLLLFLAVDTWKQPPIFALYVSWVANRWFTMFCNR